MDPTYAKRTLMLGDIGFPAVLACARSSHPFLARNATSILANYQGKLASEALIKLLSSAGDPVIKVRALAGIARKKDKRALKKVSSLASTGDPAIKAMAIYALGSIGDKDPKIAKKLVQMAQAAPPDLLFSILPAIARLNVQDAKLAAQIAKLRSALKSKGDAVPEKPPSPPSRNGRVPPNPEPAGYKFKIVADFATLAAAALGDSSARSDVLSRGLSGFRKQAWYVYAETVAKLGDQGRSIAKGLSSHEDSNLAIAAVRSVGEYKNEVAWLKGIASGGGSQLVRAAALTKLYTHDTDAIKEVCRSIVSGYSGGDDGAEAFLVGMAIQMLDRLNANDGAALLAVVQKARAAGAVATRQAVNEYDVTKAEIKIFPPLLEIATLALAQTRHPPALDELVSLVENSPVRGEAAMALGGFASVDPVKAGSALLRALVDPRDGWVRFCAYLGLRNLTGKDYFADYVFGKTEEMWKQMLKYRDWVVEQNKARKEGGLE
jgi:hypothetical protein